MNMDYLQRIFGLDGKKAIVTGGNSGIGKGIAISLASLGAQVTIVGRDPATLDETARELAALGSGGKAYKADIGSKEEIDAFFDAYYAQNDGKLDILIANAGVSYGLRALETDETTIDQLYDINFKGTLFCARRAAEAMKKQHSGNIVIVTSVNALYPLPPQAVYTTTKAAQEALARCLAVDLAHFGIRVNTLAPGAVATNLGRNNPNRKPRATKERPEFPLGRVGEPEDMGDVVACMVSDAFRYMTGSTVLVDGGLMLRNV